MIEPDSNFVTRIGTSIGTFTTIFNNREIQIYCNAWIKIKLIKSFYLVEDLKATLTFLTLIIQLKGCFMEESKYLTFSSENFHIHFLKLYILVESNLFLSLIYEII